MYKVPSNKPIIIVIVLTIIPIFHKGNGLKPPVTSSELREELQESGKLQRLSGVLTPCLLCDPGAFMAL